MSFLLARKSGLVTIILEMEAWGGVKVWFSSPLVRRLK